ncbi:MAG: RCC1 domain-containing protein [Mycoplasma sp.]
MKKTNKKIGKYLIAPIVSLFTLVTIGASVGFSPSGSLGSLGNGVAKAKVETAEAFSMLKGDDVKIVTTAHSYHSATIIDKKLFMWGRNHQGQLGIGNKIDQNKPVYVDVDGDKNPDNDNILDVSMGDNFSVASTSSGLYTWGGNYYGQLGLGDKITYETPQKVTELPGTPTQISIGQYHSAALTSSGLYTWGNNENGQLGINSTADKRTPQKVIELPGIPSQISLGSWYSAAITSSGLYTWGANERGQLGLGFTGNSQRIPQQVTEVPEIPTKISTGNSHSAALTSSGLYTWGGNSNGQLGLGNTTDQTTPQQVTALSGTPTKISTGNFHSSAITSSGLYTWGDNTKGQLGIGTTSRATTPQKVDLLPGTPNEIPLGRTHTLMSTTAGIYSVGDNSYGQLGLGTSISQYTTPQLVDHSNVHKDLNILDLSTVAGADILKEKIVADITDSDENKTLLANLIKANGDDLFTNYKENNEITIKSIDKKEASYLDKESNEFFGKIEVTFNNTNQSTSWLGTTIGNTDKKLTITKFKKSETKNISKLSSQNLDRTYTVDDLAEELEKNGGLNPDRTILDKFVKFENYPNAMKVTKIENVTRFNSAGQLTMDITVDSFKEQGSSKEIADTLEEVIYEDVKISSLAIPKESNVTAKSLSSDKTLKGLQWDNFEKYFGVSITDEVKLGQLINFNSFPKGTTYTAQISTNPTADSNKVGITVQASSYYNDKNEKVANSKTFDETIITIPMVNATSKPVERERIPKELKPENFANFVLETKPSDVKEGESTQTVNFTNLDKILKLSELFPMIKTAPELLEESIIKDTEFRVTDNAISVDGATVTFFLEANQIWNQFGFYEKMTGDWASFKVQLEFPGAHSTWVIIGSSIGAAALLFLIVLSLCNKAKLKTVITNRF